MTTILISEGCRYVSYAPLHYFHALNYSPLHYNQSMRTYFCLWFSSVDFLFAAFTSSLEPTLLFCRLPSNRSPVSSPRNRTRERTSALSLRPFILNSSYPSPVRVLPLRPSLRMSAKSSSNPPTSPLACNASSASQRNILFILLPSPLVLLLEHQPGHILLLKLFHPP